MLLFRAVASVLFLLNFSSLSQAADIAGDPPANIAPPGTVQTSNPQVAIEQQGIFPTPDHAFRHVTVVNIAQAGSLIVLICGSQVSDIVAGPNHNEMIHDDAITKHVRPNCVRTKYLNASGHWQIIFDTPSKNSVVSETLDWEPL